MKRHDSVEACVEETLGRVGRDIVLGLPLGLGKPNHLVNEFYRRAVADARIRLTLVTALSLRRPVWKGELERRLVQPIAERLFGDWPDLAYVLALDRGELPANVAVREFYFEPGSRLNDPISQRNHTSTNYTHVVRDALDLGLNVFAQLVSAPRAGCFSLSCNPDLTLDLLPRLRAHTRPDRPVAVLAQVNSRLPFFGGDAAVPCEAFDGVVDGPELAFEPFAPPNPALGVVDYAIGLFASSLVRDGGTIQLGIGALSDAITHLLVLRHERSDRYGALLRDLGALEAFGTSIERIGGTSPFAHGLYAATEMLVDGLLDLRQHGILKRVVVPHAGLQRLLDAGRIQERISADTLPALVRAGIVPARLAEPDLRLLQRLGVLRGDVAWDAGCVHTADGVTIEADLAHEGSLELFTRHALGHELAEGAVAHAGFFLGPRAFYDRLRELPDAERERFRMTRVSFVNQLYGDEELKRAQRRHARFLNSGMIATLGGAIVSDGLEDGRVVSGVGGQYNFVAMAHALEDGRSILMIRSTREKDGRLVSNVVPSYGHTTIPRHLRDVVVTEYGIADLRGRSDGEVAGLLLNVADSRFQPELLAGAKRAGKLARDHVVPERFRANFPERLARVLAPYRRDGCLPEFPQGTDLTAEEAVLARGLSALRARPRGAAALPSLEQWKRIVAPPAAANPYLERMGLSAPRGLRQRALRAVVLYALSLAEAI